MAGEHGNLPKKAHLELAAVADPNVLKRLDRYIVLGNATECWNWAGHTNVRGYGVLTVNKIALLAHRLSLVRAAGLANGNQTFALHSCDNPSCCNPRHMRWGTTKENTLDSMQRGRHAGSMGRRRGEGNPNRKLTAAQALAIRNDPRPKNQIAGEYGVSRSCVADIRAGRSWAFLAQKETTA